MGACTNNGEWNSIRSDVRVQESPLSHEFLFSLFLFLGQDLSSLTVQQSKLGIEEISTEVQ